MKIKVEREKMEKKYHQCQTRDLLPVQAAHGRRDT